MSGTKSKGRRALSTSDTPKTTDEELGLRVPRPPIELDANVLSVSDILQKYPLPRVVQCDARTTSFFGSSSEFAKPLLFYKKRSVRKVSAHTLVFDESAKEYFGVGNDLLIPEDYKGYFAVLGHPDDCHVDKVVPHYKMPSQLAISPCTKFLIGGNKPVTALKVERGTRKDVRPLDCQLLPGDILRKGSLFQSQTKVEVKGRFGRKKKEERVEHFLQCYDRDDREIMLPETSSGSFYILEQEGVSPKCPVVNIKDLLQRFQLPLVVKLVYGRAPPTPCIFTGTLLLTEARNEHTVIACTLLNHRNINLEIPIHSILQFHVAKHTPGLLASRAFQNACTTCQIQAETYMRNMKLYYQRPDNDHPPMPKSESPSVIEFDSGDGVRRRYFRSNSVDSGYSKGNSTNSLMGKQSPGSSSSSSHETNNFVDQRLQGQSASVLSRKSIWSRIRNSVSISDTDHEMFAPPIPPRPDPSRTAHSRINTVDVKSPSENVPGSYKMKELHMFQKPLPLKPDVITSTKRTQNIHDEIIEPSGTLEKHTYESLATLSSSAGDEDAHYDTIWQLKNEIKEMQAQSRTQTDPSGEEEMNQVSSMLTRPGSDPGYLIRPVFKGESVNTNDNPLSINQHSPIPATPPKPCGHGAQAPPPPPKPCSKDTQTNCGHFMQKSVSFTTVSEEEEKNVYQNLHSLKLVDPLSVSQVKYIPSSYIEYTPSDTSVFQNLSLSDGTCTVEVPGKHEPNSRVSYVNDSPGDRQIQKDPVKNKSGINSSEYSQPDAIRNSVNVYLSLSQAISLPDINGTSAVNTNSATVSSPVTDQKLVIAMRPPSDKENRQSAADSGIYVTIDEVDQTDENDNVFSPSTTKSSDIVAEVMQKTKPTILQRKCKSESTSNSEPQLSDIFGDIGEAGLNPQTEKELKELSPQRILAFLKDDPEINGLKDLLPKLSLTESWKVRMYLKTKVSKSKQV